MTEAAQWPHPYPFRSGCLNGGFTTPLLTLLPRGSRRSRSDLDGDYIGRLFFRRSERQCWAVAPLRLSARIVDVYCPRLLRNPPASVERGLQPSALASPVSSEMDAECRAQFFRRIRPMGLQHRARDCSCTTAITLFGHRNIVQGASREVRLRVRENHRRSAPWASTSSMRLSRHSNVRRIPAHIAVSDFVLRARVARHAKSARVRA